ncbi:MAG: hypothetical protein M1816_000913 [Peltula sp. TS41687]|nr:MAG: hypothetical protein M1816_000913 [Peltula sp. TS41687]
MVPSPPSNPAPPLKILMLHGYTQSGPLFAAKTRAVEKHLRRHFGSVELVYPTGPVKLQPADIPGSAAAAPESSTDTDTIEAYGWWRRSRTDSRRSDRTYEHLDAGLARLAETLRPRTQDQGNPFDGVVGFSQGGAAAAMLASLLEAGEGRRRAFAAAAASASAVEGQTQTQERQEGEMGYDYPSSFLTAEGKPIHPPLKFAVVYSGFRARDPRCKPLYEPPISTPTLHFIGSLDTVVDEERSLELVRACGQGVGETDAGWDGDGKCRVVYHPGGHFLPAQRQYLDCLVGFLREVLLVDKGDGKGVGVEEAEGGERKRDSRI